MKIIRSVAAMQSYARKLKTKGTAITLVPTMGALHEGHLSLVRRAQKNGGVVVVSIFVNPLQFGPKEDLRRYPKTFAKDCQLLKSLGVDCVFVPTAKGMYPRGFETAVSLSQSTRSLCGLSRPGHFTGVATVVLKLFHVTLADAAVFGKKDFQQLVVVQNMVRDMGLGIKILPAPIVREPDGLAMSSRNAYLSAQEREWATSIHQGLLAVKRACQNKRTSIKKLRSVFRGCLVKKSVVRLDYLEFVNKDSLQPLKEFKKGQTLVAVAVFVGKTRLIDSIVV